MKNFRFSTLVLFLFISVVSFSQNLKNVNSQPVIQPLPTTRMVVLDNNGLAKNVLFGDAQSVISNPLQVQINEKVNLTELNNREFQLRSDLATKEQVLALNGLIDSVVVGYVQVGINPTSNVTIDINSVKNSYFGTSVRNGWHGVIITSTSFINTTTFTNLGARKVTHTVYDGNITSEIVQNGYVLLLRFKDNVITHHAIYTNGFLSANAAIQKSIDSLAIHRTELNARADSITQLRASLDLKADTLNYWKIGGNNKAGTVLTFGQKIGLPPIAGAISSNYKLRFGLNLDSINALTSNYSVLDVTGNYLSHTRAYYHPQNIQAKSVLFSRMGASLGYTVNTCYDFAASVDYNTGYLYRSNYNVYNPTDTVYIGHRVGIEFINKKFGATLKDSSRISKISFLKKGVINTVVDSGSVGSLYLMYQVNNTEGSLWVQRYSDNIGTGQIGTGRREIAYSEDTKVKSALQTLQAGTNPTFDFENSIQKTLAITTVQAGDFLTPTISNIKDGGRYSIKFSAPFSTFLNFPSNVYKRDGTAFGAYTIMAEILDFVVIGSNLYCVNK